MDFDVRDLPGGFGKEVVGLDLTGDLPRETADALKALWHEAGLLLFRGAATSEQALLRLSRCFGELEPHPIEGLRIPAWPELIELTNANGGRGAVYEYDGVPTYGMIPWHADLAFEPVPNAGALLRMVRKASIGGQTAWLDTAMAYDALDPGLKRRIAGLEVRSEFSADRSQMRFCRPEGRRLSASSTIFSRPYPPIARPLVWNHPVTGRAILNIGPLNIRSVIGMDQSEGDALIRQLLDHVLDPRFVYEHDWAPDDVVLWDNYRTLHRAAGHPVDVIRSVQRSTLRGHAVVGRLIETAAA